MTTIPTGKDLYPYPALTKINGEPTYTTISTLQREIYANARAIDSPFGGGQNGHLGLVMDNTAYTTQAGVAFNAPAHPGDAPVHAAGTTAPVITATNRAYDRSVQNYHTYRQTERKLKQQLIAAVDPLYINTLEDDDFVYADVRPGAILSHLKTTYGKLTPDDIKNNCNTLAAEWNPDDPIEDLWKRITDAQRFATRAGKPITNATAMQLTLGVLERSGVFATAAHKWCAKTTAEQTMVNFQSHFNFENKERIHQLTATGAGYHGTTRNSIPATVSPSASSAATDTTTITTPTGAGSVTAENIKLYYCWTHGLGRNPNHTSQTCKKKGEGHKDTATFTDMQGGARTIMGGGRRNA